jgi:hypothetical protein
MMSDYISAVRSKGRVYFYSRFPARFGLEDIRLPDDRAQAESVVKTMMLKIPELESYCRRLIIASRARAKEKNLAHNLRDEDALGMLASQKYRCAVSGVQLSMEGPEADPFMRAFAPSLDRIDNDGGYIIGNCRLVCRIVNFAMGKWISRPLKRSPSRLPKGVDRERRRR